MIDRPSTIDLLEAMAVTLSDHVVPACDGGPQHAARVVANLCRILARETVDGAANTAASVESLQQILGDDSADLADLVDLVAKLDDALAGPDAPGGPAVHKALLDNVERRLAIAKPSYR